MGRGNERELNRDGIEQVHIMKPIQSTALRIDIEFFITHMDLFTYHILSSYLAAKPKEFQNQSHLGQGPTSKPSNPTMVPHEEGQHHPIQQEQKTLETYEARYLSSLSIASIQNSDLYEGDFDLFSRLFQDSILFHMRDCA